MKDISSDGTSDNVSRDDAMHYDQFFGPMYFEPFAIEVAKRIDPSRVSVVLEIAAGTGRVTRHIREHILPSAKLIASDISQDMLTIGKEKLSHLDIDWQIIDAQQLPFDDNTIDLVVCCFGFMFVRDRPKAFAEVYRVLKSGGQVLFTTWDSLENNGASFVSRSIAVTYLDKPLPISYSLATSMSDEVIIRTLLLDAKFEKISIEKVTLLGATPSAKEAAYGLVSGDVYEKIKKRNPADIDEIKILVEKELAQQFGDSPMIAPISALINQAWK